MACNSGASTPAPLHQYYNPPKCRHDAPPRRGTLSPEGTIKFQATTKIEAFGECKTLADWARDPRCRVTYAAVKSRLQKGWAPERALSAPARDDARLEAFGERKTIREWASDPRCVVTEGGLTHRLRLGEPIETALTRPRGAFEVPRARRGERLLAFGELKTAVQWARDPRCIPNREALNARLRRGMDPQQAITTPVRWSLGLYEAFGESKTLADWARDPRAAAAFATLEARIDLGWDFVDALVTPPKRSGKQGAPPGKSAPPARHAPSGTQETVEAFGEHKTLREWAADKRCRANYRLLRDRLLKGWPVERALGEDPRDAAQVSCGEFEAYGECMTLYAWSKDPRCVVRYETLKARVKRGEPFPEAMEAPVAPRRRRRRGFFDEGPSPR